MRWLRDCALRSTSTALHCTLRYSPVLVLYFVLYEYAQHHARKLLVLYEYLSLSSSFALVARCLANLPCCLFKNSRIQSIFSSNSFPVLFAGALPQSQNGCMYDPFSNLLSER